MIDTSCSDNSPETIDLLRLAQISSHTPADYNLDNDFDAKDRIFKSEEHEAIDDLAVSLCKLKLLEEQKYVRFCQRIPVSKASHFSSGFCEIDIGLLLWRQPSIS